MSEDTKYTIAGDSFTDIDISTNNKRFKDEQISTGHVPISTTSHSPSEFLNISVDYRVGITPAASIRLKPKESNLMVSQLDIKTRVRSKGLPRFTLGMIYGVALWANKGTIWGLVDYSKSLEEMLINAGFPSDNIVVSGDTSTLFFSATLEQIDFDDKNFHIVRND